MRHAIALLLFAVIAAMATGCTTVAPLRTDGSTSGIRAAEEVGAAKVPQASLHLLLAKEELARAKGLAAKGDKEQADSMLRRAEADAELAVALAREDSERTQAQDAMERVRQLQMNNE